MGQSDNRLQSYRSHRCCEMGKMLFRWVFVDATDRGCPFGGVENCFEAFLGKGASVLSNALHAEIIILGTWRFCHQRHQRQFPRLAASLRPCLGSLRSPLFSLWDPSFYSAVRKRWRGQSRPRRRRPCWGRATQPASESRCGGDSIRFLRSQIRSTCRTTQQMRLGRPRSILEF